MIKIFPILALKDNYIWCLYNDTYAWIVDPGAHQPVIETLDKLNVELKGLLITHHHADHTQGVSSLKQRFPSLKVVANAKTELAHTTLEVKEGDIITLEGLDISVSVIETPGHTLDHLCYFNQDLLLCGDTLFSGGCGRLFEGTPRQMQQSLQKLAALAPETKVLCAHEYTEQNLKFAKLADPNNEFVKHHMQKVQQWRQNNQPSLPSNLETELKINPFLRCSKPSLQESLTYQRQTTVNNALECFTQLRQWKDEL